MVLQKEQSFDMQISALCCIKSKVTLQTTFTHTHWKLVMPPIWIHSSFSPSQLSWQQFSVHFLNRLIKAILGLYLLLTSLVLLLLIVAFFPPSEITAKCRSWSLHMVGYYPQEELQMSAYYWVINQVMIFQSLMFLTFIDINPHTIHFWKVYLSLETVDVCSRNIVL